jgi:hypothetical protein
LAAVLAGISVPLAVSELLDKSILFKKYILALPNSYQIPMGLPIGICYL